MPQNDVDTVRSAQNNEVKIGESVKIVQKKNTYNFHKWTISY